MFGYVNISQGSISDEDKKLYSAYYCGLCKAIGKKSQISRLTLSNDLTFLLVMLSAVDIKEPEIYKNKHCIVHAVKKHDESSCNDLCDYVSDMNILLVYLKICDDVCDDGTLKDYAKRALFSSEAKKIEKKYPDISQTIRSNLAKLAQLEKENCPSIDMTADCFAKILEAVFSPKCLGFDDETLSVLKWIGYNIGRWIYIIDAYADIEKDKKSGSYNPFLSSNKFDKELVAQSLSYTLANAANAYDLLKIYRNDSLIRNFLYSGLPERQEYIFTKTEETDGSL